MFVKLITKYNQMHLIIPTVYYFEQQSMSASPRLFDLLYTDDPTLYVEGQFHQGTKETKSIPYKIYLQDSCATLTVAY